MGHQIDNLRIGTLASYYSILLKWQIFIGTLASYLFLHPFLSCANFLQFL